MIQGKLEDEIRKRADVIKQKKKTESQIQDLESQIVGQNKYLADLNKELILNFRERTLSKTQFEVLFYINRHSYTHLQPQILNHHRQK